MKIDRVKGLICALLLAVTSMYGFVNHPKSQVEDMENSQIGAIAREDGSGTREAFTELFDLKKKQPDGSFLDLTSPLAAVTNSTSVILMSTASDPQAIGYVSMGSLNNSVKTLSIDGVIPSLETVKDNTYKITRSFQLVVNPTISECTKDFIDFIQSQKGQAICQEEGYIPIENKGVYEKRDMEGKISVSGSSSVTPLLEKMAESYQSLNPKVEIEIQQSDSSSGIANTAKGLCDIGMTSRDIKEEEKDLNLKVIPIAKDAIVLIVNPANEINDLSLEEVKDIYTGKAKTWKDVI